MFSCQKECNQSLSVVPFDPRKKQFGWHSFLFFSCTDPPHVTVHFRSYAIPNYNNSLSLMKKKTLTGHGISCKTEHQPLAIGW